TIERAWRTNGLRRSVVSRACFPVAANLLGVCRSLREMTMALELVQALAKTELDDHLHMARLLMLFEAHSGRSNKPVEGVTKLAKLDFLLRYPNCLERALIAKDKPTEQAHI